MNMFNSNRLHDAQSNKNHLSALDIQIGSLGLPVPPPLNATANMGNAITRDVVFIDSRVTDSASLLKGLVANTDVVFLDKAGDGLQQMVDYLAGHLVKSVQIIAHGFEGQLWLGKTFLDNTTLNTHSEALASIGKALVPGGDILVYSCNLAAGDDGASFVASLARLTGTDVAASSNRTGLGGDWDLEVTTGKIEAASVLSKDAESHYDHSLATLTVTTALDTGVDGTIGATQGDDATDGGGLSLREAINWASSGDTIAFNANMTVTLAAGQLQIAKNLTIVGDRDSNGTPDVTIDANYTSRVLNITSGNTVTLDGLIITHGSLSGTGGNGGTTATNGSDALGAGIANAGTLTIKNSTITANGAAGGGGGGGVSGANVGGGGGGGGPLINGGSQGTGASGGTAFGYTAGSGASGAGGNGASAGPMGGAGGATNGGAGGVGDAFAYSNGGAGATASSGSLRVGGGGGGSGWDAIGKSGGNAAGGIYNASTGTITVIGTSAISHNVGAGGGGGGGSGTGSNNLSGGDGGIGAGGVYNKGTFNITSANFTAMTGNVGVSGSGGLENGTGVTGNSPSAILNLGGTGTQNTNYAPPAETVTNITSSKTNGSYTVGEVITITITFSGAVDVTGTPQLTLETGTVDRTINYASGTGTNTLSFTYTVQSGDISGDLDYHDTAALALNSGTIKNAGSSTNATLTLPSPGAAGSLGANKALVIDTTAPAAPSAPDMTTGTDTGSSNTDNLTSSTTPVFTGTAEAGCTVTLYDTDGTTVLGTATATGGNYSITSSALSAGPHTITAKATDAAGNVSIASSGLAVTIDTTVPTVNSVSVPANATYNVGQNLDFTVNLSENVTVTGSPKLDLTLDTGGTVAATYLSGSGTSALVFRYTVVGGNLDTNGVSLGANIALNGGTLKDTAGNDATLTLNGIGALTSVLVDGVVPTVSSINRTGAASTNATSVGYTVSFSESVTGADTSDFALTATSGVTGTIASVTGSGTTYTVTVNGITGDGTLRLDLKNSGTGIADAASNAIANGYTAGQVYTFDTTAPTVSSVTVPANATYIAGQALDFTVNFNETVTVNTGGGTPRINLTLDTGGTVVASYLSGSGTSALVFRYTIASGNLDSNGVSLAGSIDLNGGILQDAASNNATLTLNGVGALTSVLVDGVVPTVNSVSVPANATYSVGQNLDFTVNLSENVAVTGSPKLDLTLDTGGTVAATYLSGSGTNALVFRYTVVGGNLDTNGVSLGANIALNGGSLKDIAGNDATLTLNSVGALTNVLVDGVVPTVSSINRTGAASTNATSVGYTVTFSESVAGVDTGDFELTATGTVAGTIASVTGSGTTYTVTVNGITGDGTLRLDLKNSGTGIADAASNAIATGYTAGQVYTLDTTAPAATSTPDMTAATDTGVSNTDNITANTTPAFTGTAEANSTVKLYDTDGITLLGTNTADGAGNWTITSSALANGPHTIKATATDAAGNVGVLSTGLSVSIASPSITSASYDTAAGVLTVTGTGMLTNDTIDVSKLTLVGESGASYTLTAATSNPTASSATSFVVTLGAADKLAINGILNKNGLQAVSGTVFNLEAALNWDSTSSSSADLTGNAITVSNVAAPTITSAAYDVTTHILTVTGTGLVSTLGAANDISVSALTIRGEGAATRTLSTTGNVEVTSATSFAVTLAGADQAAVEALFNKNGTTSTSGTTYNLAAADDWDSVITGGIIAVTTSPITVSNVPVPTITSSTYDASTGVLTVTGSGFRGLTGVNNDIIANKFSLQGEGGASYTLNTSSNVEITSATSLTLTLSAADRLGANLIMNKNGTSATSANTYNLVANEDWNAGADGPVVINDLTGNGITVSNVVAPTVTSATYNVGTGVLVVTGNNFLSLAGGNNDIIASQIGLFGQGSANYSLTNTPNVDITSNTSFTMTMSLNDRAQLAIKMNKDGTSSTDNTTYNLRMAEDWNAGADGAVVIEDLSGNSITVTGNNVAPTITGAVTGQAINQSATVSPFASIVITDPDVAAAETVTITLDSAAKGAFTAASLTVSDFSTADAGVTYTHDVASPAAIQAALRALVFQPTAGRLSIGSSETATFTLSVSDGIASPVLNNSTTVVISGVNVAPNGISLSSNAITETAIGPFVIGTLSSTDSNPGDTHTYTFDNTDTQSNYLFNITGDTINLNSMQGLTVGDYQIQVKATDAGGLSISKALTIRVDDVLAPSVSALTYSVNPKQTNSLHYLLRFNEAVSGVDVSDFSLITSAGLTASLQGLTAIDTRTYQITVGNITGQGSLHLDLKAQNTGIMDAAGFAITGGITGATYFTNRDGDNISDMIESAVPNLFKAGTGDGNGDGIADSLQSNVSSIPWKELPGGKTTYLTLANKPGIEHAAVDTLPAPLLSGNDLALPFGLVNFNVNKVPLNQSVKFSLFTDANAPINGFWVQDKAGTWVNLATNISLIDGEYRVDLQITDSSPFDLTAQADGKIQIQGGLGWKQSASAFSNITADWDNDGIPDAVEAKMGTNPFVKDNNVLQRADMFAMQMYRDFLFREADTTGLNYWVKQIEQGGMSREQVAASFLVSTEFQKGIGSLARLYFGAFDRVPDRDGLAYWITQFKEGMSLSSIARSFVASTEFEQKYNSLGNEQFLDLVYQNVLHRPADAGGKAYWMNQLISGFNRGDLLASFTESTEFKAASGNKVALTLDFVGLLGRAPDPVTFNQLLNQPQTDNVTIIGQFIQSAEYIGRFME